MACIIFMNDKAKSSVYVLNNISKVLETDLLIQQSMLVSVAKQCILIFKIIKLMPPTTWKVVALITQQVSYAKICVRLQN